MDREENSNVAKGASAGSRRSGRKKRNGKKASPDISQGNRDGDVKTNNSQARTDSDHKYTINSSSNAMKVGNGSAPVGRKCSTCLHNTNKNQAQDNSKTTKPSLNYQKNAENKFHQQRPSTSGNPEVQTKKVLPSINKTKLQSTTPSMTKTETKSEQDRSRRPETTSDRFAELKLNPERTDQTKVNSKISNQKKECPNRPTKSENSPERLADKSENIPLRLTKSDPESSGKSPHPQGAYPKGSPQTVSEDISSRRRSFPLKRIPAKFSLERAEELIIKHIKGSKITRKSPDLTEATVKYDPDRPPTAATLINQMWEEEYAIRRDRHAHARRVSTKIGKTFQALEETLPPSFQPKERTREAILDKTRSFTKLLEDQMAAAPATSMCLVCDKPRIACGCEVPEYLRQPGQRMEDYIAKTFEGDENEKRKFRIRVYEEEVTDDDNEDDEEKKEKAGGKKEETMKGKGKAVVVNKSDEKKKKKDEKKNGSNNNDDNNNKNSSSNNGKDKGKRNRSGKKRS